MGAMPSQRHFGSSIVIKPEMKPYNLNDQKIQIKRSKLFNKFFFEKNYIGLWTEKIWHNSSFQDYT